VIYDREKKMLGTDHYLSNLLQFLLTVAQKHRFSASQHDLLHVGTK
jgi:hypothetical protein